MLKTNVKALRAALLRTLPACEGRTTIPILAQTRLTTEAGVLTVSTTNLDMQVDVEALAEVSREGQITINPRQALGVLRYLAPSDPVEIAHEGDAAFLCWPGGKARIFSLPACDFPDLNMTGDPVAGRIGEFDYAALRRVRPFISTEETRYYLSGVCLDIIDGQPVVVATDGHRMGVMPLSDDMGAILKAVSKPIVPREAVRILLGLNAGDADLTFYRNNESALKVEVSGDGVRLRSKLIDGAYPAWQRVLPRETKLSVEFARAELQRACNIALAFASGHHHDACLVVENGRQQLQAKGFEGELAINLGVAPANVVWELQVNAGYLMAAISAVRGASVTISAEDDNGPTSVAGSDTQPGEHVVIMPLRSDNRASFSAPLKEAA